MFPSESFPRGFVLCEAVNSSLKQLLFQNRNFVRPSVLEELVYRHCAVFPCRSEMLCCF